MCKLQCRGGFPLHFQLTQTRGNFRLVEQRDITSGFACQAIAFMCLLPQKEKRLWVVMKTVRTQWRVTGGLLLSLMCSVESTTLTAV